MEGSQFSPENQFIDTAHQQAYENSILPHNIEAEQELLGTILLNNEAYDPISDIISPDHFFEALHGQIYAACAKGIQAGLTVSPVTLKAQFEAYDTLGEITVPQYLGKLAANAMTSYSALDYARTIKDLYLCRQAIFTGEQLINSARHADAVNGAETAIEEAQSALDKLRDHGGHGKCARQQSLAQSALSVIEELKDPTPNNTISTSLKDLDKVLNGGWARGELTIVAARPSVGKSAFITSSMLRSAKQGYEVLCFSMEMQKEALAARCLSDITYTRDNPIPYADILGKRVEQYQWERLEKAQGNFADYTLEVDDERGLTVTNIQSRIRRYINKLDRDGRKLDLVVVDHLGKIRAEDYAGQRHLELGAITEQLAVIAGQFDVAVVVLCQLNRGVEGRDNKRPTLADLRESGRIEEDAHTVISLHRPGYYLERMKCDDGEDEDLRQQELKKHKNTFEAAVLKQRNGVCRPVDLWCNMATNTIGNKGRG